MMLLKKGILCVRYIGEGELCLIFQIYYSVYTGGGWSIIAAMSQRRRLMCSYMDEDNELGNWKEVCTWSITVEFEKGVWKIAIARLLFLWLLWLFASGIFQLA